MSANLAHEMNYPDNFFPAMFDSWGPFYYSSSSYLGYLELYLSKTAKALARNGVWMAHHPGLFYENQEPAVARDYHEKKAFLKQLGIRYEVLKWYPNRNIDSNRKGMPCGFIVKKKWF